MTFNICNYLGTVAAGLIQWPGDTSIHSQVTLLLLAALRVAFIPIFMLCNLAPSDRKLPVRIAFLFYRSSQTNPQFNLGSFGFRYSVCYFHDSFRLVGWIHQQHGHDVWSKSRKGGAPRNNSWNHGGVFGSFDNDWINFQQFNCKSSVMLQILFALNY